MTRVLVAAASAVTRAGLEAILAREASITIVGRGTTRLSLAEEMNEEEPDVVLVESTVTDDENPLGLLRILGGDFDDGARHAPAIVLLTDDSDPAHVAEALRSGIRAVLPRDAGPNEIIAAVNSAAAGLVSVAREWTSALHSMFISERTGRDGVASTVQPSLTPRELEILRMLADGLANKQIAARLAISEHTVKFHVSSVFAKIHASTRAEAVMIGARRGLIVV